VTSFFCDERWIYFFTYAKGVVILVNMVVLYVENSNKVGGSYEKI